MRKIFFLILIIFNFTLAQSTFKFFEFAPRSQDNFQLVDKTFIQSFIPFNDYLSGVGFWLSNHSENFINLKLIDSQGRVIVSKNFKIPVIKNSWWGKEFVLDLGKNFPLVSGDEYGLIITSQEKNNLTFFAKNLLELLQGTENYLYFSETLKPFKINNSQTNFSLKFSLYENKENDPPIILNLEITFESATKTKITFNSNEPIIYNLYYQIKDSELQASSSVTYFESCPPKIRKCSVEIDTLPGKFYLYKLIASDFWQNQTVKEGNFQTPLEPKTENQITSSLKDQKPTFYSIIIDQKNNLGTSLYVPTDSILKNENVYLSKNTGLSNFKISSSKLVYYLPNFSENILTSSKEYYFSNQSLISTNSFAFQDKGVYNKKNQVFKEEKNNLKEKFGLLRDKLKENFWQIFIFVLGSIILLFIIYKLKIFDKSKSQAFSLYEIVLVLTLLFFSVFLIILLVINISNFNSQFIFSLGPQKDVVQTLDEIGKELRAMQNSNIGSYPLVFAGPTKIVFYSDIEDDGLVEEISYFVEGDELKKSIITPTGNPLTYDPNQAKIRTKVTNLVIPQQVFTYYDENFQETLDLSKIKIIKVSLQVKPTHISSIFSSYIFVTPRNLLFK